MVRWTSRVATASGALLLLVGRAAAHDPPDSRFQSPIPLDLLFVGAGAVVGATALLLALADGTARPRRREGRPLHGPRVRRAGQVARAGFVVAVAGAVLTGLAGVGGAVATGFVWAVWLKGVALVAALVGSPWRWLSPWRAIYDVVEPRPLRDYPDWLGRWPALAGFLLVAGVAENLTAIPESPAATAVLVGGYALAMLAGAAVFGREGFERADFFAVLYGLFGRVAPLRAERVDGGYRLQVRAPWDGCAEPAAGAATVAFVVATVYTVSFDGFTNTIRYEYLLGSLYALVGSGAYTGIVAYAAGYLAFLGGYVGVVAVSEALGGGRSLAGLRALAPTVLPIAVAYEVAHTYPLVARETAAVLVAVTPLEALDPLAWLSVPAFWGSQVLLITAGHVVAVVAAHRVTARRYPSPGRGHLPLAALMVGYTVLSLWIVSLPVVR